MFIIEATGLTGPPQDDIGIYPLKWVAQQKSMDHAQHGKPEAHITPAKITTHYGYNMWKLRSSPVRRVISNKFISNAQVMCWLVVWPPLWKIWSSIGIIYIPNISGKIPNGRQPFTTNQLRSFLHFSAGFSSPGFSGPLFSGANSQASRRGWRPNPRGWGPVGMIELGIRGCPTW